MKEYEESLQVFETENYEFKIQLNRKNPEGWIKTIVAFANERGGILFIGVTDEGFAKGFEPEEVDKEKSTL